MGSLSEYGHTARVVHGPGYLMWCPKYRRPVLGRRAAERQRVLVEARCAGQGWPVEAREIMSDHVRLFARCGPGTFPARLAHQLKGATSPTLREEFPRPPKDVP